MPLDGPVFSELAMISLFYRTPDKKSRLPKSWRFRKSQQDVGFQAEGQLKNLFAVSAIYPTYEFNHILESEI